NWPSGATANRSIWLGFRLIAAIGVPGRKNWFDVGSGRNQGCQVPSKNVLQSRSSVKANRSIWFELRLTAAIGPPGGNFLPGRLNHGCHGLPFHHTLCTSPLVSTANTSMKLGSRDKAATLASGGNLFPAGIGSLNQSFHPPVNQQLHSWPPSMANTSIW